MVLNLEIFVCSAVIFVGYWRRELSNMGICGYTMGSVCGHKAISTGEGFTQC